MSPSQQYFIIQPPLYGSPPKESPLETFWYAHLLSLRRVQMHQCSCSYQTGHAPIPCVMLSSRWNLDRFVIICSSGIVNCNFKFGHLNYLKSNCNLEDKNCGHRASILSFLFTFLGQQSTAWKFIMGMATSPCASQCIQPNFSMNCMQSPFLGDDVLLVLCRLSRLRVCIITY